MAAWTDLHESVLVHVLAASTPRTRAAASAACARARSVVRGAPRAYFPALRFRAGCGAARCKELMSMLAGAAEVELAG